MDTSNGSTLTVLLAGCSDVAGMGLRALLSSDPRFTIVGEMPGDVARQAQRLRPDVIVLDLADSSRPNVALITGLAERTPQSHICVYTSAFEPRAFLDAMIAGAWAYLLKADIDGRLVADTLALVGRYRATVIDPAVRARFEAEAGHRLRLWLTPEPHKQCRLSVREHDVVRLLAQGYSDKPIAAQLGIKDTSVRRFVERAKAKVGAATPEQLMVLAVQQGLLEGDIHNHAQDVSSIVHRHVHE